MSKKILLDESNIKKLVDEVRSKPSAHEILPGLFLGNEFAAVNKKFIDSNNISVILNCTPDVPNKFNYIEYLRINIDDSLKPQDIAKMTTFLPCILAFLYDKHTIKKKNVLVHCHAGMQRSAVIVAGYLMKYSKIPCAEKLCKPMEVINYIINIRPVAFRNKTSINFEQSLRVLYKNLKNGKKLPVKSRSKSPKKNSKKNSTKSVSKSKRKTGLSKSKRKSTGLAKKRSNSKSKKIGISTSKLKQPRSKSRSKN